MDYQEFLRNKAVAAPSVGFEVNQADINPVLFPYQRDIVQVAASKGRYALFAECGLGKTFMQLEWARLVANHTGGKVLILAPLAVASQTVSEAAKLGLKVTYCRSDEDVEKAGTDLIISNYEMLKAFDTDRFAGVVLDESSILKNFTGTTKRQILDAFKNTQYKLACTATPAPNDHLELGNHAEFLGVMPSNEMIMRWFLNDQMQAGNYRLKRHAEKDFWRWVTTWAVCISKPGDIGYSDEGFELPPLSIEQHLVGVDHTRAWGDGQLFLTGNSSATSIWKDKAATLQARCLKTSELVKSDTTSPWIVWVDTNDEADALKALLPANGGLVEVRGSDKLSDKERKLNAFTSGEARTIITKPEIAGLGLNWQHCANMVFAGATFSYERLHQALRRSYRFRQANPVKAHIIMAETETNVMAALQKKQEAFQEMQRAMSAAMKEHGLFASGKRRELVEYNPQVEMTIPEWLKSKKAA